MTEKVEIDIVARDKASGTIKKVSVNMKELGEKVTGLGMRLSAITTLPVLALGKWVSQNKEIADTLAPIGVEFAKIRDELAVGLLPVLQEAMPSILEIVRGIGDLAKAFSALDTSTKQTIVTAIGVVAALGPIVSIIGQVMATIGLLQGVLGAGGLSAAFTGLGAAIAAIGAPVIILTGLLAALFLLVFTNWDKLVTIAKQLISLGAYALGGEQAGLAMAKTVGLAGRANGGPVMPGQSYMVGERGPEILRMGASGGQVIPLSGRSGGNGGANVYYTNNGVDLQGAQQIQALLDPFITKNIRRAGA